MVKQKQCIDFYGERLNVGDHVIPILDEALFIGIGGVISKIEYNEKYNNHYITITDNDGKVLLDGVDARCYTTQARYDEREKQKYVYRLVFFDNKLFPRTTLPLTNKTDVDYEMPEDTRLVVLWASHLVKKDNISSTLSSSAYSIETIYNYFFEEDIKLYCDGKNEIYDYDFYYVINNSGGWYPIYGGFKIVENKESLKQYVKAIIEYFKTLDLSQINNDVLYQENKELQEFEKKLIHRLNN